MLIKCKTKSSRVKGITFHPSLHFLLASMHSGEIQLWNYMNSTLVDVFSYHEGPVRGIDFHLLQPLFVSGGDDTNVVVWDFKQKKMLFALSGHTDYVRTVQFHPNYPWILSASDDQTIRIWNWQGRSCISVLQGHTHYVMCARFHPKQDLLVSASLDQTARIWDVTVLREKNCAIQMLGTHSCPNVVSDVQMFSVNSLLNKGFDYTRSNDRLSFTDVTCLYNLCGHEKGVNWAIFHDTMPCVITAGDDKTVRIWRYNGPNIWQTNILRGHYNNVCSLIMHPNGISYLLSVSEDRSIKVWDTKKWTLAHTFVLEKDRFWVVQNAKDSNYIAAGHDTGFIVFKLFKERPIVTIVGNTLYYVWNDVIYSSNLDREVDLTEEESRKGIVTANHGESMRCSAVPSPAEETNCGQTLQDLFGFHRNMREHSLEDHESTQIIDDLVFPTPAGEFCRKNRTKILTLSALSDRDTVMQRFMAALLTRTQLPSNIGTSGGLMFPFAMSYNHYCPDKSLFLVNYTFKGRYFYEVLMRGHSSTAGAGHRDTCHIGAGISACFASREWLVAVDPSNDVVTHNLEDGTTVDLNIYIKVDKVYSICSGIVVMWSSEKNVMIIYDIENKKQLRLASVPTGKLSNVLVSQSKKLIAAVFRNNVTIYDRELGKLASEDVRGRIKTAAWYDNSAIIYATSDHLYYLMVNGDSGILRSISKPIYIIRVKKNALYIMQRDHKCYKMDMVSYEFMFKLALYYNHLESATKLIEAGKIHGNAMVAYLIEKNRPSLARMIITDPRMRLELALRYGNINEALEDAQVIDEVDSWKSLGDAALEQGNCVIAEVAFQKAKLFDKLSMLYLITGNTLKLKKMLNICKFRNDVTSTIQHALYLGDMGELAYILKENKQAKLAEMCETTYGINGESGTGAKQADTHYMVPPQPINRFVGEHLNWPIVPTEPIVREARFYDDCDPSEADPDTSTHGDAHIARKTQVNVDIWGSIDEFDNVDNVATESAGGESSDNTAAFGRSPLDLVTKGEPDRALDLLERSFGLCNRALLADVVAQAQQSQSYDQLGSPSNASQHRMPVGVNPVLNDEYVGEIMNRGYAHVTAGSFENATTEFRLALRHWIFLVSEASQEYIEQCRIYITAMILEAEREKLADIDIRRSLELAAYFSCCNMLPQHQYLVMRRTMGIMWKAQNYTTAAKLIKRLLAQDVSNIEGAEEEMEKAKRIYALCEKKAIEMHSLDYDDSDERDLSICTVSLVKTKGRPTVHCGFCGALALEKFVTQTCNICQLCKLTR
ncbi:Coatomer subunit alpha-1 [Babesia sp. Xinjiang]|uniref:Coatomer subunit alpha-1 n=1 Tax=Babesia sp. Xinjiang TaxID=462227 RepID=UPI000A260A7C|nr:Coatomer subunit alpha-1 [Babesia sp. Xinjiang]ORM41771.1 Coatomer subunit alpha-1 [Babesia sp. Xinjiang]